MGRRQRVLSCLGFELAQAHESWTKVVDSCAQTDPNPSSSDASPILFNSRAEVLQENWSLPATFHSYRYPASSQVEHLISSSEPFNQSTSVKVEHGGTCRSDKRYGAGSWCVRRERQFRRRIAAYLDSAGSAFARSHYSPARLQHAITETSAE